MNKCVNCNAYKKMEVEYKEIKNHSIPYLSAPTLEYTCLDCNAKYLEPTQRTVIVH